MARMFFLFAFALVIALALAPLALRVPARSGAAQAARAERVEPAVRDAVDRDGAAPVIVTLRQPDSAARSPLDRTVLRTDARLAIDRALARLQAGDIAVTHRYQAVAGFAGTVTSAGLARLGTDPDVISIALDRAGTGALSQSVPLINADDAHILGWTGAGLIAAVLDSGADNDHPDLADAIIGERCILTGTGSNCPGGGTTASGPGAAEDDLGHGTNVTGIITSNGTVAPKGVAPSTQIFSYKILNSTNTGLFSDWVAALDDIVANHPEIDLVNMSLQSYPYYSIACDSYHPAAASAVTALRTAGVLVFAAAGNNNSKNGISFPGCLGGVISVGAVYDVTTGGSVSWPPCSNDSVVQDRVTCFSDSAATLDLLAPGAFTTATGLGGGLSTYSGTSMASPHALGVAALVKQAVPGLTASQLEARLEDNGVLITDPANNRTTPRVDAMAAINDAPPPTPTPTLTPIPPTPTPTPTPGPDADGDGCADSEEVASNAALGGQRDPLDFWDFYDVTGDKSVDLSDTLDILAYFGDAGTSVAGNLRDRDNFSSPQPWQTYEVDDGVDLTDALVNLQSFGHDCSGPP